MDIALGETTYRYLVEAGVKPEVFIPKTVHLKGYDLPTQTYAGLFSDLDTFLQSTQVQDKS
jgi:adenylate cyclase